MLLVRVFGVEVQKFTRGILTGNHLVSFGAQEVLIPMALAECAGPQQKSAQSPQATASCEIRIKIPKETPDTTKRILQA